MHYSMGFQRNLGIIHAHLRLICGNLNAHLFNRHVIDNPTYICSNEIENCEHFFLSLPYVHSTRWKYFSQCKRTKFGNGCLITVNLLLFGRPNEDLSEVINRHLLILVESFISESNRFAVWFRKIICNWYSYYICDTCWTCDFVSERMEKVFVTLIFFLPCLILFLLK